MTNQILKKMSICLALGVALFIMATKEIPAQEKLPLKFLLEMYPTMDESQINYYALVEGKVQAPGLKLDIKTFWPWDTTRMMIGGEGDVGVMTINGYLMAKDRGVPLVMIGVQQIVLLKTDVGTNIMFVRRASGIKTAKELEGKKVGLPGLTSASAIYHRAIFQHKYGVDLGKITWVDKGTPELFTLLKKGDIEAANVFGGVADKAMEDPELQVLYWAAPVWKEMTGMPLITMIIAAKKGLVEKQPEAVKGLLTAIKLSKKYGEENRSQIIAELMKKFGSDRGLGSIIQPIELTEEHKEAVKRYLKYSLEQKIIRKEPDPADLFADLK